MSRKRPGPVIVVNRTPPWLDPAARGGDVVARMYESPRLNMRLGEVSMTCYEGHLHYGGPDVFHCRVTGSEVKFSHRREGIATRLYTRLAREAKKMGATFHSDKHVSPNAQALWKSFVAKGWAVPTEGRYWYRWVKP